MAYEQVLKPVAVHKATSDERKAFIRRTYLHLAGAIAIFAGLETILLGPYRQQVMPLISWMLAGRWNWAVVLLAFLAVGFVADRWAHSKLSTPVQYLGLGIYILAEVVIFLPLLHLATAFFPGKLLPTAALITGALFLGLTLTVFLTRKDFSYLRSAVVIIGSIALGLIFSSLAFGFSLGVLFSAGMIAYAGICILYSTSQIMHHYRPGQHVAASLALFAAVALMFWYVIRILMRIYSDD